MPRIKSFTVFEEHRKTVGNPSGRRAIATFRVRGKGKEAKANLARLNKYLNRVTAGKYVKGQFRRKAKKV
jgi:hypothetical protein